MKRITFLGSGSMSTACAQLLAAQPGVAVRLWGRDPAHVAAMATTRENARLLPGIRIPEAIEITADAATACAEADCYVVGIPSQYLREGLSRLKPFLAPGSPSSAWSKGSRTLRSSAPARSSRPNFPVGRWSPSAVPANAEESLAGCPPASS